MKTAGVVLLLLWSGQVVIAAQNQDVQTTNTGKDAIQLSDIHTVLREMSNVIAEQGAELKCTKTKLEAVQKKAEAMEKKAEAMEKKAEAMESRLRDSEKTVAEQRVELTHTKTQLEAVEGKTEDLESLVNQLKTENKVQSVDLNATVAAVSDLERERAQSRVSFFALLLGEGSRDISGVDALVFQLPITNIGNAYNRQDGKFRAPIRGVYWFAVYIYGRGHSNHPVAVTLQKNGERVALAYTHQPNGGVSASNGASLLLEKGDEVWVKLWPGAWVYDSHSKHTTFSGHLLFTM